MLIEAPFAKNPDDWHCVHAAMQGVIKHFSGEHYSLDYLNALMNSSHGLWVWPFQATKALHEVGLFVRLFSNYDFSFFRDLNSIRNAFSDSYINKTDMAFLSEAIDYISTKDLSEKKPLSLMDIEDFLRKGCIPIVILGSKKKLGKYVMITGFDSKNFYYHDTGPRIAEPHKKIDKEKFLHLWSQTPSKNMAIVVYGKRFKNSYTRFHF
jgi:hypothetical protein